MNVPWTSSSVLLREVVLEGDIVNISPLRIGAGREAPLGSTVDLAVIRIRREGRVEPYIPGSSLKGVFRSHAEAIARTKKNIRVPPCNGLAKSTCMDIRTYRNSKSSERPLRDYIDEMIREGKNKKAMEAFFKEACVICKIFGALLYASKVNFSDAYPVNGFSLGVRTGIAIDRRTGAVARGALYQVEYVEPGTNFHFSINSRNLPNYALGLLFSVVNMIKNGEVRIGGFKTRGFGQVTIKNLKFMAKDVMGKPPVMRSLEENVDLEVDLKDMVKVEDGWMIAEGDVAWEVLDKFKEVWNNAKL